MHYALCIKKLRRIKRVPLCLLFCYPVPPQPPAGIQHIKNQGALYTQQRPNIDFYFTMPDIIIITPITPHTMPPMRAAFFDD
ncbi:MAG: hypothetical protein IKR76_11820, partial [Ruminococcus sp.]|nr:hypothetical protein [Ruminococcus sp.]